MILNKYLEILRHLVRKGKLFDKSVKRRNKNTRVRKLPFEDYHYVENKLQKKMFNAHYIASRNYFTIYDMEDREDILLEVFQEETYSRFLELKNDIPAGHMICLLHIEKNLGRDLAEYLIKISSDCSSKYLNVLDPYYSSLCDKRYCWYLMFMDIRYHDKEEASTFSFFMELKKRNGIKPIDFSKFIDNAIKYAEEILNNDFMIDTSDDENNFENSQYYLISNLDELWTYAKGEEEKEKLFRNFIDEYMRVTMLVGELEKYTGEYDRYFKVTKEGIFCTNLTEEKFQEYLELYR